VVLENILVPLDGSPLSEAALPFAQRLARRAGARLTLIRTARAAWSPLGDTPADQQRALTQAEDYLRSLEYDMAVQGFEVQTGVPYGASPAGWIVEEIGLRHADLVVMATHDRSGPERWIHGSVAEQVVHSGTAPVMLVRASDAPAARRIDAPEPTLIVPLDGSDLAEAALPVAVDLAVALTANIVLVGIVPRPGQLVAIRGGVTTYVADDHASIEADAWAYLEASVGRAGRAAARVEPPVVRLGEPAVEIAQLARERSAVAVVMATHGRTGLVRTMLGSTAGGVLHRSTTPVVLIRPQAQRPVEQPIAQNALAAAGGW
jgi:nucleotide-binding universal stress UspA family protein